MAQTTDADTESTTTHPLEPLTADEIARVVAVVREADRAGKQARFAAVTLREPAKAEVLGWEPGALVHRAADVLLVDRATGEEFTGVVSLTEGAVTSWERLDGHTMLLFDEMFDAIIIAKEDPRWQEAMRKRGVTDFDAVQCDPWPAGNFDIEGEEGRRLVRLLSYVRHEANDNGYAHPVEGVVATIDTIAREVIRLEDHGVIPLAEECSNFWADAQDALRDDLKPLDIVQPDGVSFTVDGHEISWQKWRLRVSMHPNSGLVLHTVDYDGRSILYRAGLSEMVVPYGADSPNHRWKNAFDSGELGLGRYPLLNSLELGCDCLGVIHYLPVAQVGEQGDVQDVPNAICVHEEDFGILWKHVDLETFEAETRRSRRLVVSAIHTAGNYEYGFYWYFYLDGSIELEVKLTGILQTMGVPIGEKPAQGELVAPGLAAPNHQHLFCYRLDFDVDGAANTVVEVEMEAESAGSPNGAAYANSLTTKRTVLRSEAEAKRDVSPATGRHWLVTNPSKPNRLGNPVAYRLLPGTAPRLLAPPQARINQRAGFVTHNLWVTPHDPDETRAGGFPNLHSGGAGLPAYTAGDRSVEDTDVVVWYSFGVNHIPRPEDFPVMPVERVGFALQPFGFFDRNPALDVPPTHHH